MARPAKNLQRYKLSQCFRIFLWWKYVCQKRNLRQKSPLEENLKAIMLALATTYNIKQKY